MIKDTVRLHKRKLIPLLVALMVLVSLIPMMETVYAVSPTLGQQYTVDSSVSHAFTIEGQPAFCMDHDKRTPHGGIDFTRKEYTPDTAGYNANIAKALYYGWGGPGNIFSSVAEGTVGTALALDHFAGNGDRRNNSGAEKLINKVNSAAAVNYTYYIYSPSSNSDYQRLGRIGTAYSMEVDVTVRKTSSNPDLSHGNDCYSLAGAEFEVWCGGKKITTVTTNAQGIATTTIKVKPDDAKKIIFKEITAPKGFALGEQQ